MEVLGGQGAGTHTAHSGRLLIAVTIRVQIRRTHQHQTDISGSFARPPAARRPPRLLPKAARRCAPFDTTRTQTSRTGE